MSQAFMNLSHITAKEFDDKALSYETNRLAPWYIAHAEYIFNHLTLKPGSTVLDIGCGTGYLLRRIARTHPHVTGIGIDLAPKMVEVARKKACDDNLANLNFVQSDWEQLNKEVTMLLAEQPASHVICANAFHYFAKPQEAIASMHSVLLSGGEILLLERAKEGSPLSIIWDFAHRFLIKDNVRFYDSFAIIRMLQGAGFRDVKIQSRLNKIWWKNKFYTSVALISGIKDLSL